MLASKEDPPALLQDQLAFWDLLPAAQKGAIVMLQGGEHAMAGANPHASAMVTDNLWSGKLASGSYTIDASITK
jgi:hypothetical protein